MDACFRRHGPGYAAEDRFAIALMTGLYLFTSKYWIGYRGSSLRFVSCFRGNDRFVGVKFRVG
jgi:hypothetical protein